MVRHFYLFDGAWLWEEIPTLYFKESLFALSIYGIEICKTASSYGDFCEKMKDMERVFVESLKL